MASLLKRFKNAVVDVFDANTEDDQKRRIAANQPRFYQDQQRQMAASRPVQQRQQAPPQPTFTVTPTAFLKEIPTATGKVGKGLVSALTSSYGRVGNAVGETLYSGIKGDQEQRNFQEGQKVIQSTLDKANQKLKDPTVTPQQRERWNSVRQSSSRDLDKLYAGRDTRLKEVIDRTDPVKGAAAIADVGLDLVTAGTLGGAKAGLKSGKLASKSLAKEAAEQASKSTARRIAEPAITSGISGGFNAVAQNGRNTRPLDIGVGVGIGATAGAALGGASALIPKRVQPKLQAQIPDTKLRPNEAATLSDLQDVLTGRVKNPQTQAAIIRDARTAAQRNGLDVTTGTPREIQDRINTALEQPQNTRRLFTPLKGNEIGAIGSDVRREINPRGVILSETKPKNGQKAAKVLRGPGQSSVDLIDSPRTLAGSQLNIASQPDVTARLAKMGREETPFIDQAPRFETKNVTSKQLDTQGRKEFQEAANKMLGARNAAQTRAAIIGQDLPKLNEQESLEAIRLLDQGGTSTNPRVQQLVENFRGTTDTLYKQYKGNNTFGKDVGYVEEYLPRIYKNPENGELVDRATFDSLILGTGRTKGREADLLREEALVSKDPRELMRRYVNQVERKQADLEFFRDMQSKGLIVEAGSRPQGLQIVDAPGMPEPRPFTDPSSGNVYQGNFYADPSVAKELNKLFSPNDAPKLLRGTQKISSGVQKLTMSGGLPMTPLNSFGTAQWLKQSLSGRPITATKSFFRSFSDKAQRTFERQNAETIVRMQRAGVPYSGTINAPDAFKTIGDDIAQASGAGKAGALIKGIWDKSVEDPTFKRLLPSLQLDTFKGVYQKQIAKGLSEEQASRVAADATRNAFGINPLVKDATRSKTVNAVNSTILFAPRFRESMVNFWLDNAKALGNPTNPAYRENLKFLGGATLLFGAMQAANYALNGHSTFQNENKYDRLNLSIPTGEGKSVAIPFLSSIATVPRMAINAGVNLATGNPKDAASEAKGLLSQTVRPIADLATNQKWNKKQIYNPKDGAGAKFADIAAYVGSGFSQPWIKAGVEAVRGESSGAPETIATAVEAPLRFREPFVEKGSGKEKLKSVKVTVDGKQKDFGSLNVDEMKTAAKNDSTARDAYEQYRNIKNVESANNVLYPADLDQGSINTLRDHDARTTKQQEEYLNNNKQAQLWLETAKYKRDVAEGKISDGAEKIKREQALARYKVGADYDKTARDLYGLNKTQLYGYLSTTPGGSDLANQILAYDDALVNAGIIAKNKLRDKYGNVTIKPKVASSGGRKGKKGKKTTFSTAGFKTAKIGRASTPKSVRVKQPKAKKTALKRYTPSKARLS